MEQPRLSHASSKFIDAMDTQIMSLLPSFSEQQSAHEASGSYSIRGDTSKSGAKSLFMGQKTQLNPNNYQSGKSSNSLAGSIEREQ